MNWNVLAVVVLVIFAASFVSWQFGYAKGRKTAFSDVLRHNEELRSRLVEIQARLHHANRTVEELENELYHDNVWNNARTVPDQHRQ